MKKVTKIEEKNHKDPRQKIRVAAYVRVSTSFDDQLDSLKTQTKHFQKLIQAHPEWENVGLFVDEGISGTSMHNRQGLRRLMEECRIGNIDLILTKSISRFSRNLTECLSLVRELTSLNVAIHFDKENINTQEMDGELLLSVLVSLAENESKSISENLKWGIKKRIENNAYKHISAPYGYMIDKGGQLKIDPDEAKHIRMIFNEYLSGVGSYRIAKKMMDIGVAPPRGKKWRDSTIRYILTNETYVGDFLYQKTYTDSEFNRQVNEGNVEQLYVPDDHEAIISREDFDKVQVLLTERSGQINASPNTCYPLTQKIRCGYCGGNFIRRTHYSSNETSHIAWACSTHLEDIQVCPMRSIKETEIQEAFMTLINKLIFGRKEIVEGTIEKLGEPTFVVEKQLKDIDQQLVNIQANFQNLSELLASELIDIRFYQTQVNRLEREKKEWFLERTRIVSEDVEKSENLKILKQLNGFLKEADYYVEYDASVLSRFLEKVVIENRATFHFHLKGGLILTERRTET